jgi:hypothetical protein
MRGDNMIPNIPDLIIRAMYAVGKIEAVLLVGFFIFIMVITIREDSR